MRGELDQLHWTDSNSLVLLQNGVEFFSALCAAINTAKISVHLETYIFCLDRTGRLVLECLEAAARRGVKVRVVLDGFGCAATAEEINECLSLAGRQCRVYRPEPKRLVRFIPSLTRLRRLHRKVKAVDAQKAFIGGINIVDNYDDHDDIDVADTPLTPRFDFAVQVQGSLVPYVVHVQDLLWVGLNWMRLRHRPTE